MVHAIDEKSSTIDIYNPINKFEDFQINQDIKRNVFNKGYAKPTTIQDQSIPHILNGRDLIGIANTGTGKTGAFLIPLIEKVVKNREEKVLIVTPTRELACQINDELLSFSKGPGIHSVLCIGGTSMFRQKSDLRRQFSFVIGTPGRVKDMINSRKVSAGYKIIDQLHDILIQGSFNKVLIFGRTKWGVQKLSDIASL